MSEIIDPLHSSGAASSDTPILDASGEMLERVRVHNWSATPLGAIDSWSTTLASYVRLVLMSPQPAVLIWGQELTLFYNDGAIPTLGEKHPKALGRSYRDVFADAWPLVGQDIENCLRLGKTPIRKDICIPLMRDGH